jgi:hypothetical protein
MNNLSSYCGLVDAKIRASDKDLPVLNFFFAGVVGYMEELREEKIQQMMRSIQVRISSFLFI